MISALSSSARSIRSTMAFRRSPAIPAELSPPLMSGLSLMCYLPGLGSDGGPCWPPSPAISYTSAKQTAGALAAARLCGGLALVLDHLEELVGIGTASAAQDLVAFGVLDDLDDGDAEGHAL